MLPSAIAPPIRTMRSTFAPPVRSSSEGDVRERARRHERDRARGSPRSSAAMKSTACSPSGARPGGGSAGPSRPLSPWTWEATVSSRSSGRVGAGGDGNVGAAGQVEHAEGVLPSSSRAVWLPCTVVTPSTLELGAREREQQGDRVVVPRVAVDDDRNAHACSIAIAGIRTRVERSVAGTPRGEYRVDLGRGRQGRLRSRPRGGERTGRAGPRAATPRCRAPRAARRAGTP